MKTFTTKVAEGTPTYFFALDFDQRSRSRVKIHTDNEDVLIVLHRGQMLLEGDLVATDSGEIAQIMLKEESLCQVECDDVHVLARACYHLGNRHLAIEIQPTALYFRADPVIADMVEQLGLTSTIVQKKFYPEHGVYGGGKYYSNDGHTH